MELLFLLLEVIMKNDQVYVAAAVSEKQHTEDFLRNKVYVENDYSNIKYALDVPAKYEIPTTFAF